MLSDFEIIQHKFQKNAYPIISCLADNDALRKTQGYRYRDVR